MKKETLNIKKEISGGSLIENYFFDFIVFIVSFILSFFRSSFSFFSDSLFSQSKNYFFDFLDFAFRIWPSYFWKRPSLYKISSFLGSLIESIFLVKK